MNKRKSLNYKKKQLNKKKIEKNKMIRWRQKETNVIKKLLQLTLKPRRKLKKPKPLN
jgi:hypothetical protein